jgi:hypothetical protein
MSTASKNVDSPSKEIEKIIEEVQAAANATQSEAYRYEDYADGSRLEIRCFPKPWSKGEKAPRPAPSVAGSFHVTVRVRVG